MCAKATMEDFEALLKESFEIDTPEEGTVVKGRVIAIEAGQAIIDVGYKMEGRIDIKELVSAPVPCERGAVLGKIQVPPDATAAESYAAYELQRVLQRLTGRTPGLEGRDRTAAGRAVRVGRAAGAAALA